MPPDPPAIDTSPRVAFDSQQRRRIRADRGGATLAPIERDPTRQIESKYGYST
jgi:hypothetical protein